MATLIQTVNLMRTRGWTAFAFGGTPRGIYDNGKQYRPRDLDLVFDDEHFLSFESAFERYIVRRNSYGGLRMNVEGLSIDAWPLKNTWAFRQGWMKPATFENLPATTFLNIDAIIIEITPHRGKQRRVFEKGFFSGWHDKTMDINFEPNPYPAICVARTLHMARRFGFRLSRRLVVYLWRMLGKIELSVLERWQIKHYGYVEFEIPVMRKIRVELERYLEEHTLFPMALFQVRPEQLFFPNRFVSYSKHESRVHELRESEMRTKPYSRSDPEEMIVEQDLFVEGLFRDVLKST